MDCFALLSIYEMAFCASTVQAAGLLTNPEPPESLRLLRPLGGISTAYGYVICDFGPHLTLPSALDFQLVDSQERMGKRTIDAVLSKIVTSCYILRSSDLPGDSPWWVLQKHGHCCRAPSGSSHSDQRPYSATTQEQNCSHCRRHSATRLCLIPPARPLP